MPEFDGPSQVAVATPEQLVDVETAVLSKKVTEQLTSGGPPRVIDKERSGDEQIAEVKAFSQSMMGQNGPYFQEHPILAKVIDMRSRKEIPTPDDGWNPTPWDTLANELPAYNDDFWKTYLAEENQTLAEQSGNFPSYEVARQKLFPTVLRHTSQIWEIDHERRKLEDRVYSDALTGLKNKAYLQEKLPMIIEKNKAAGVSSAVLKVDVDRFKDINDNAGHDAGDGVLQAISELLINGTRPQDIVIRSGGDEFDILLQGVPIDLAMGVAERLRQSGHEQGLRIAAEGVDIPFTFSIGVASSEQNDIDQILKESDIAMYQSKQARNKVTLFQEGMTQPPSNSKRKPND